MSLRPWRQPGRLLQVSATAVVLCAGLAAGGCSSEPPPPPSPEMAYVRGADVPLLDQLGPESAPIGNLSNGDEVEILGNRPRWTQVRTASGQTGWLQSRYLASPDVRERFRAFAEQSGSLPSQGTLLLDRTANLHLEPGRDTETFYQLAEGAEPAVLAHRVASRSATRRAGAEDGGAAAEPSADVVVQTPEDWLLVRDAEGRTGWMLESLGDMNPPFEVGQYREGLRIRAWFVIHQEMDDGVEHAWYLWATIRRLAGLPYDFDEIRVFVWNPSRDRYETSYRERNLIGYYPIRVGTRDTPGGPSPTFALQVEDETGKRLEKQYVMENRVVRTVQ